MRFGTGIRRGLLGLLLVAALLLPWAIPVCAAAAPMPSGMGEACPIAQAGLCPMGSTAPKARRSADSLSWDQWDRAPDRMACCTVPEMPVVPAAALASPRFEAGSTEADLPVEAVSGTAPDLDRGAKATWALAPSPALYPPLELFTLHAAFLI